MLCLLRLVDFYEGIKIAETIIKATRTDTFNLVPRRISISYANIKS